MGYQTSYDLSDNSDEVNNLLGEVSGYETIDRYEEIKWYSCHKDMVKVSKMLPDQLITVHGEGEESRDIWSAYALNGKIQVERAEIVVGKFDESKLKEI